jgi:hypothetical protein
MAGTCALCEHRDDSRSHVLLLGISNWAGCSDQQTSPVAQWVHRKRPIMACSSNDSVLFPCNHYLPHVVQYGHDSKCPLLELRVMSLLILVCKKYIQPTFRSLPDTFKYFMSHIIAKTWPSALNSPIIGEHRGERKISFV